MLGRLLFLTTLFAASTASAIPRDSCPKGTEWNVAAGACVKKKAAPRMSAQDKFNRANDDLEGRGAKPDPKRGITLLEQACTTDKHAQSCTLLGFLYARGRAPVSVDATKASQFYTKGCELKDLDGCVGDADFALRIGRYDYARTAFQNACGLGSAFACGRFADLLDRGIGGAADADAALPLFQKAMTKLAPACPPTGWAEGNACFMVGFMFEKGKGTAQDNAKALAAYQAGCAAGGGDACNSLGDALNRGLGGQVDAAGADAAHLRACEDFDHGEACETLAQKLSDSKPDVSRAKKLAERACELDPKTCGSLGRIVGYLIAEKDDALSTRLYRKACDSGGLGWCQGFAIRAHQGKGMARDDKAVSDAVERACMGGYGPTCAVAGEYLSETDPALGVKLALRGCDLYSEGNSCFRVGWYAAVGKGGDKDPVRALTYYTKSCDLKSVGGCDLLGSLLQANKDLPKAAEAFKKACDGFGDGKIYDAEGCVHFGRVAYLAEGMTKDVKAATNAFLRACQGGQTNACSTASELAREAGTLDKISADLDAVCKAGNEDGCVALGNVKLYGTSEMAKKEAYELYAASCKRGHTPGCVRQADLLSGGVGTAKDPAAAEKIYRPICDNNNQDACFRLANVINEDEKRRSESHRLYMAACEAEIADACNSVGYQFNVAQGVAWDLVKAAKYYVRSCDLRNDVACSNLAYLYRYGVGVKVDHKKAFEMATGACKPPTYIGCDTAGHYQLTGEGGVTQIDRKAAEASFKLACEADYASPEACRDLATMTEEAKGSPGDVARMRTKAFTLAKDRANDNPYYAWLLGTFYATGMATVTDPKAAIEWFSKGCEKYEPLGCIAAGKALQLTKKKEDSDRARVYFERACAAGVDAACNAKAVGPTPIAKHGCCSGEVAPGAEAGAIVLLFVLAGRRRRRRRA